MNKTPIPIQRLPVHTNAPPQTSDSRLLSPNRCAVPLLTLASLSPRKHGPFAYHILTGHTNLSVVLGLASLEWCLKNNVQGIYLLGSPVSSRLAVCIEYLERWITWSGVFSMHM